jgi:hypothetical protein
VTRACLPELTSKRAIRLRTRRERKLGRLSVRFRSNVYAGQRSTPGTLASRFAKGAESYCSSGRATAISLRQPHVKQRQPVLKGLQNKAAEDQHDAERAEAALRQIVRVVLDIGIHRYSDARDEAGHEPYPDGK